MPRKDDASGSQHGSPLRGDGTGPAGGRQRLSLREESAFGLAALSRTLDEAALNMSTLALDGTAEALRGASPLAAAEATRRLADQVSSQMKGLEIALAEVVNAGRR